MLPCPSSTGYKSTIREMYPYTEGILSPTQETLDPEIFEQKRDGSYVLWEWVRSFLLDVVATEFVAFGEVVGVYLVGSILSYQWEKDSDIDLSIVLKTEDDEDFRLAIEHAVEISGSGKLYIPETQHRVEPYIVAEEDWEETAKLKDGIYDVVRNKWIKGPYSYRADVARYMRRFRSLIRDVDIQIGELKRDLIDFDDLFSWDAEALNGLYKEVQRKIREVNLDVKRLVRTYEKIHQKRTAAFTKPLTPAQLRKYATANLLPSNVIYKLLQRYHYLRLLKAVTRALEKAGGKIDEPEDVELVKKAVYGERRLLEANFWPAREIPKKLFHGTTAYRARKILKQGLKPREMPYGPAVWLCTDYDFAWDHVAKKTYGDPDNMPTVLRVRLTRGMRPNLYKFRVPGLYIYKGYIPPERIEIARYPRESVQERYGGAKKLKSIWYHGTSPRFLRSILSKGLIPDPKEKAWEWDPEASFKLPSRASHPGVYVTKELRIALEAAKEWQEDVYVLGSSGRVEYVRCLIVVLLLQPRTMVPDEDDLVPDFLAGDFGESREDYGHVAKLYFTTLGYGGEFAKVRYNSELNRYKRAFYALLDVKFNTPLDNRLKRVLDPLLEEAWKRAVTRAASHFLDISEEEFEEEEDYVEDPEDYWAQCFAEVGGDPRKAPPIPDEEEAEESFAEAVDKIAKTISSATYKGIIAGTVRTARLLEPVTFRGANRIVAVFELTYRIGEHPAKSMQVTVHYGKLPEETKEALKNLSGQAF